MVFILYDLNLGGTEKSLISLLHTIDTEKYDAEVLLMRDFGALRSHLPKGTKLTVFPYSHRVINELEIPLPYQIITQLKNGSLLKVLSLLILYFKIRILGDWSFLYNHVLRGISFERNYDVAIAYAGPHDFITYFIYKKVTAKKKVQWIHFDIEKVITNFNFGRKYYPFFDRVFCVSQSAKDIFVRHFPKMTSKTEVFHNIVSETEIKKQALLGETFADDFDGIRLLTVGRFTKEKGQHLIPDVAKRLKDSGVRFQWYLVGDGIEKSAVEKMGYDLKVDAQLIFLGEKQNPYRYMQDCDMYIQPSLHEGYGITVAEAKVFNKPIVVTDFASAKDLITNNVTGLIADISAEYLYFCVKKLLQEQGLRQKFIMNLETEPRNSSDIAKLTSII